MRRKAAVKAEVLQLVARSPLPVRQTLKELKLSSATYCRWRRRYAVKGLEGLQDLSLNARRVWNRLRDEDRGFIVAYALEHPSLSAREVAARLVDLEGRFVSESTVYRVLREAGLVKPPPRSRAFQPRRSTESRPPARTNCGIPMPATSSLWGGNTTISSPSSTTIPGWCWPGGCSPAWG